jgi:hypothetical protein
MYHCPDCGEMVVAGVEHPDYEEFERYMERISKLKYGDLVHDLDQNLGVVLDPKYDERGNVLVAMGNGTEEVIEWYNLAVVTLRGSEAACNFAEWFAPKVGPTGAYPRGQFSDSDQGELQVAVGSLNGRVVFRFGTPVSWLAMPPEDALTLAEVLAERVEKMAGPRPSGPGRRSGVLDEDPREEP